MKKIIEFLEDKFEIEIINGKITESVRTNMLLIKLQIYCKCLVSSVVITGQLDREDATQDLWIKSIEVLKSYKPTSNNTFKTYLYRCLLNHLYDNLKSSNKRYRLNSDGEFNANISIITNSEYLTRITADKPEPEED